MHKLRSDILSAGQERPSPVAGKKTKAVSLGGSLAAIPVKRTASRTTNQRDGERIPGVIARTALTLRRKKYDARVVNISSDGAMLEVEAEFAIGERVGIELGDGGNGACIVRWIRDGRVGLEFDGYTLDLGRGDDGGFAFRRSVEVKRPIAERAPRQSLVWRATLIQGHDALPVRLANVSTTGALLDGALDLVPGAAVMLDFAGIGMMPSTVRWCKDGRAGLLFDRHFDVAALAICAKQGDAVRAVEWVKPEYLMDERDPDSPHAGRWEKLTLADLT